MIQHSCVRNSTSVFMYFHDCIISGHYGKSTWSGSCSRRAHTEQALMSVRSTTGDEEHTTVVMTPAQPRIVLLFSGKRKSGKDYVTDLLQHRLTAEVCCILRLSAPLKLQYAQDHNLDYEELLGCGQYKEEYRADMIRWGEMKRRQDSGFFCRLAIRHAARPVWIISDCRRRSDLQWFRQEFPNLCVCVRVEASEQTRSQRGWRFTAGVDDAESECGLDEGVTFDWIIRNDGDDDVLEKQLEELLSLVTSRLDSHTLNDVKTQQ